MAGHIIFKYLKQQDRFNVIDISRSDDFFKSSYKMDVTDFDRLRQVLQAERPSYVINCIGVLNKEAEDHPDKAILLNSYLPHLIAKSVKEYDGKLIHISTDCVFNGEKGGYTENAFKDGIGFYAQSKALGEVSYDHHLTLRTSIIGPELKTSGIGLFDWFMKQTGPIKGYAGVFWTGVTTIELAKAVESAMTQDLTGLYHLVNGSKISKYELLQIIGKEFSRESVIIEKYDDYHSDKSLINSRSDFNFQIPSYEDMIREMKGWMLENKELYFNYSL